MIYLQLSVCIRSEALAAAIRSSRVFAIACGLTQWLPSWQHVRRAAGGGAQLHPGVALTGVAVPGVIRANLWVCAILGQARLFFAYIHAVPGLTALSGMSGSGTTGTHLLLPCTHLQRQHRPLGGRRRAARRKLGLQGVSPVGDPGRRQGLCGVLRVAHHLGDCSDALCSSGCVCVFVGGGVGGRGREGGRDPGRRPSRWHAREAAAIAILLVASSSLTRSTPGSPSPPPPSSPPPPPPPPSSCQTSVSQLRRHSTYSRSVSKPAPLTSSPSSSRRKPSGGRPG